MEVDGFFLVWNPQGRAPTYKHCDRASAEAEARRLALANRGQEFVILGSVASFSVSDPVREVRHIHGAPF